MGVPTSVSALIHSAAMVTAGVILSAHCPTWVQALGQAWSKMPETISSVMRLTVCLTSYSILRLNP